MSEFYERLVFKAAKAIVEAYENRPLKGDVLPCDMEAAQAAVQSTLKMLGEPSEDMVMAGLMAPNYLEDQSSARGCRNIWQAMLKAIQ